MFAKRTIRRARQRQANVKACLDTQASPKNFTVLTHIDDDTVWHIARERNMRQQDFVGKLSNDLMRANSELYRVTHASWMRKIFMA